MKAFHKIIVLAAAGSLASSAMADTFAGVIWGQTSSNYSESSLARAQMPGVRFDRVINDSDGWGLRFGQDQDDTRYYISFDRVSDTHRSVGSFRQRTVSASYDFMAPLNSATRVFLGGTAGLTDVRQDTRGYRNDTDRGFHAGLQAGLTFRIADQAEVEAGYRYNRHFSADVDFSQPVVGKTGTARLNSTDVIYAGVNFRF